jgi:putative transposase
MIAEAIDQLTPIVGTSAALAAVGADRATWYRHHRKSPLPERPEQIATPQPRALTPVERKQIKALLESDEFVDEAPPTVYAKLLDQGIYLGSVSTMYRILHEHDEVRERRRQATHPAHKKPELIATQPNEIWSWDITKLHGAEKWTYYYLYVILDIYSRYAVGWMLARAERAQLSKALITESIAKHGITKDRLTLHSDRGSPMIAKPVAHLLADLGVTKSHSRPHVSNDNPVLRITVPDLQVPTRLPRPVRQFRGRPCALRSLLRLV